MKILIVDDHGYNRDLLSFILQDDGHDCVEAEDGAKACEYFEDNHDIDLILMDVNMPVMDGISATRNIKSKGENRFVPVIFVTALDDAEMIAKCLDAGGDDFVPKPVNESVLSAKINAHARTRLLYNNLQSANVELQYHKQMLDRELAVVERIFTRGADRIKTSCVNACKYSSPMSMFNGDIVLEAPSPSGGVYHIVGDFTGHGLASSIGTLPVSEIFFTNVAKHSNVAQIASEINTCLVDLLPDNMFFCASVSHLDRTGTQLTFWAGGMNDMLLVKPDGESVVVEHVESEHMPLGILTPEEFDESPCMLTLDHGVRVYIYTDGVNEAINSEGVEFGLERLEEMVRDVSEGTINALTEAVHEFSASGQTDDISILEIRTAEIIHRDKEDGSVVDVAAEYHNAQSFPWEYSMRLSNGDLRNTSVVNQLMSFVGGIQGIELHQDKIFTIVSELYSNALEHGVLELDSSLKDSADGFETYYRLREERLADIDGHFIHVDFSYLRGEPNRVKIVISDSGKGFNFESFDNKQEQDDNEDDDGVHGRGLHLLKSLCSTLVFSDKGRVATATYDLQR